MFARLLLIHTPSLVTLTAGQTQKHTQKQTFFSAYLKSDEVCLQSTNTGLVKIMLTLMDYFK